MILPLLKKAYFFFLDFMQTILLAASIFLVIYIFLFRPFQVSGESMYPTFKNKEYVLTHIMTIGSNIFVGQPKRGDVIVFKSPTDKDKDYIKRVIGLPGDTVYLKNGFTYLNNKKLDEHAYLSDTVRTYGGGFMHEGEPVTVPEGKYLVFGDNRPFSSDSREWGFLERKDIIGESIYVYWPLDKNRIIENPYPKELQK